MVERAEEIYLALLDVVFNEIIGTLYKKKYKSTSIANITYFLITKYLKDTIFSRQEITKIREFLN